MRRGYLFLLATVVGVWGCSESILPPPPSAVPPVAMDSIVAEYRQALVPLTSIVASPTNEDGTSTVVLLDGVKEQVLDQLKAIQAKYRETESGEASLIQARHEVEELLRQARDQRRWKLVLASIEVYETLFPDKVDAKIRRLKDRATIAYGRPRVVLRGFFDDLEKGDTYAFLQVTLIPQQEMHVVKVRPGEEFLGLRFVDIEIGRAHV